MTSRMPPSIILEKINLERFNAFQDAILESGEQWFRAGMIPKAALSEEELDYMIRAFLVLWEKDDTYMFYILDQDIDQVAGIAFLNRMNRMRQFANLGYAVRISRQNQGIATSAASLVARYGFEQLELQRIEIVVCTDHPASLRVAEKLGAVREGLLRNGMRLHGVPCNAYLHSLIPSDLDLSGATDSMRSGSFRTPGLSVFFNRKIKN